MGDESFPDAPPDTSLKSLEAEILGHSFTRPELLAEALTHSSAVQRRHGKSPGKAPDKTGAAPHGYERLEFLGDRVLGLVVAELLLRRFPDEAEGPLARRLAHLVRREALHSVALSIGLGRHIRLSAGEDAARTRHSPSILADICEAVIAALYLDGGLDPARNFIHRHWEAMIDADAVAPRDAKTALQEWAQGRGHALPRYEVVGMEGPAHARIFTVTVTVDGAPDSTPETASGASKRAAESAAAAALMARIQQNRKIVERRS